MVYLLITHVALGASLVIVFMIRYAGVLLSKLNSKAGKRLTMGIGSGVILSGTVLAIVGKSSLSTFCISSIVIISLIVIAENVLQKIPVSNK